MNQLKPNFKMRLIKFIFKSIFAAVTIMLLFMYLWIITP